jgi:iron complex outermembrane recepter protein
VPLASATYVNGSVLLPAGTIDDPTSRIGTTFSADLAIGWHFDKVYGPLHKLTASLKVGNLFNSHALTDYAGTQSATQTGEQSPYNLYLRQPGRSVFFNLEAHI